MLVYMHYASFLISFMSADINMVAWPLTATFCNKIKAAVAGKKKVSILMNLFWIAQLFQGFLREHPSSASQ